MLLTGSAGFIGSHLSQQLAAPRRTEPLWCLDIRPQQDAPGQRILQADISDREQLRAVLENVDSQTVLHLAADAQAFVPLQQGATMMRTNVLGTLNLLELAGASRFIFASSSSVYGDTSSSGVASGWEHINPLGLYAASKVAGELACRKWAGETQGVATCFRFGNVVGPGCRGLIPYLVDHAHEDPEGRRAVQLRGDGALVRDYIPVEHVTAVMRAAMQMPADAGSCAGYNIATGQGMTNKQVSEAVAGVLRKHGYQLSPNFSNPRGDGETETTVLRIESTRERFDIPVPTADEVLDSIERATEARLEELRT